MRAKDVVTTPGWRAWVAALRTGDEVNVRDAVTGETIFTSAVKVTETGRVFLANSRRERRDWRQGVLHVPGGGPRFIDAIEDAGKKGSEEP